MTTQTTAAGVEAGKRLFGNSLSSLFRYSPLDRAGVLLGSSEARSVYCDSVCAKMYASKRDDFRSTGRRFLLCSHASSQDHFIEYWLA